MKVFFTSTPSEEGLQHEHTSDESMSSLPPKLETASEEQSAVEAPALLPGDSLGEKHSSFQGIEGGDPRGVTPGETSESQSEPPGEGGTNPVSRSGAGMIWMGSLTGKVPHVPGGVAGVALACLTTTYPCPWTAKVQMS